MISWFYMPRLFKKPTDDLSTLSLCCFSGYPALPDFGDLIFTTASVHRDTQTSFPLSVSIRVSHTWVDEPRCRGFAIPTTFPPSRTGLMWFAFISSPTAVLES